VIHPQKSFDNTSIRSLPKTTTTPITPKGTKEPSDPHERWLESHESSLSFLYDQDRTEEQKKHATKMARHMIENPYPVPMKLRAPLIRPIPAKTRKSPFQNSLTSTPKITRK
jgi:hypothetical protein